MATATKTADWRFSHGRAVPALCELVGFPELLPYIFGVSSGPPHLLAGGNKVGELENPDSELTWEGQERRLCRVRLQIWGSDAAAFQDGVMSDLTESRISRAAEPDVALEQRQETQWGNNRMG